MHANYYNLEKKWSYSQGRSVYTYDVLVESKSRCNPLQSSTHLYQSLDNKLVYLTGVVETAEVSILYARSCMTAE